MKKQLHISNLTRAFTLVELSIVLVIIGLLTAGVVGGQSLIESSKRQNFIRQMTQLDTAVTAFKLEYDSIPGDMSNAYDYWGNNCNATASWCNGNGDGRIYDWTVGDEFYSFWTHLYLAGLWDWNNGLAANTRWPVDQYPAIGVIGYQMPLGQYYYAGGPAYVFKNQHAVYFLDAADTAADWQDGAFTTKTIQQFEKKVDDNSPLTGIILSGSHTTGSVACAYNNSPTTKCTMLWYMGF